ncbi:uncharacterized protein METZ01_LOCUS177940, partial [marine metagenome]
VFSCLISLPPDSERAEALYFRSDRSAHFFGLDSAYFAMNRDAATVYLQCLHSGEAAGIAAPQGGGVMSVTDELRLCKSMSLATDR